MKYPVEKLLEGVEAEAQLELRKLRRNLRDQDKVLTDLKEELWEHILKLIQGAEVLLDSLRAVQAAGDITEESLMGIRSEYSNFSRLGSGTSSVHHVMQKRLSTLSQIQVLEADTPTTLELWLREARDGGHVKTVSTHALEKAGFTDREVTSLVTAVARLQLDLEQFPEDD